MSRALGAAALLRCFCVFALLMTGCFCTQAGTPVNSDSSPPLTLTNLLQLRRSAEQQPSFVEPYEIAAQVLSVDAQANVLVLRDASAAEFIHLDLKGRKIDPGDTVDLRGRGWAVKPVSFGLTLIPNLAVDNDGIHAAKTESGSVYLQAGLNPIDLRWFNRLGEFNLNVEYEGPNLSRQPIPASALFRSAVDPVTGHTNSLSGLDCQCYEGAWDMLPDFRQYHGVKTGVATNFDLGFRTRDDNVGLEFTGLIAIPRDGVYTFHLNSDDGSLLFVGVPSADLQVLGKHATPAIANGIPLTERERNSRPWVALEGTVDSTSFWNVGGEMQMRVGNDEVRVEVFDGDDSVPKIRLHDKVRVQGIYEDMVQEDGARVPGVLFATSWNAVQTLAPSGTHPTNGPAGSDTMSSPPPGRPDAESEPPVISTAAEVKALSADLAKQELPVSIRGVITVFRSYYLGAVIQDSTRGVYLDLHELAGPRPLKRGELCEIDGVTGSGYFAPVIVARKVTHLGMGPMPEPVHATWQELMNGSLDTEYVQIDGVVTDVKDHQATLLTESGKVTLDLSDIRSEALSAYENALVRVRGCVFASFDMPTRKLEPGSLLVSGAAVDILEPAPSDLFDAPQKSIGELLFYDPKAAPFRLLKVSGQVVYGHDREYFLMSGTNGIHVLARNSDVFSMGDKVDTVGFLQLGGPAVEFREALLRKTGHGPLPAPTDVPADHLLQASYAATRVAIQGTLMDHWYDGVQHVLELQSGFVAFRARMASHGRSLSLPPDGSRLKLTGVYVPQGLDVVSGNVAGFELLLSSPADIQVLSTPPWWTLKRVLVLACILATLLGVVLVWNKELQWKVQERSRQLETEIRNRQQSETQRAAEAERSRIARDLHDELGTGLTEVSLLAGAGLLEKPGAGDNRDRFRVIAEKASALVSGLDVIVWAIDPKRNSLQSFADYLGRYATELFSSSNILCRFKIPIECDAATLDESSRHSLFLAVKEALNNVIRHAGATEVELRISQSAECLEVVIADNGRGFDWKLIRRGNGLENLQERLKALNGQCDIHSEPGKGTTIKFAIPLAPTPNSTVHPVTDSNPS